MLQCQSKREPGVRKAFTGKIKEIKHLKMTSEEIYFISEDVKDDSITNPDLHLHFNRKKKKQGKGQISKYANTFNPTKQEL